MRQADAPAADAGLVGRLVGAKYRVVRLLGEGGMGAVYEATTNDGSRVALKVLREHLAEGEMLARFVREATMTRELRSEHVVPVLDAGVDDATKTPWLVMPILSGVELAELLQRTGPLLPATAVSIAIEACAGLSAAHGIGIVHRDVKPSNIFLETAPEGRAVVRIFDFGIAKSAEATGGQLTGTGMVLGTPLYMSPEQARSSKSVDPRTDVYSIGVALYEMLCGSPPFGDLESVSEILAAVLSKDVPPIRVKAPWIDPELAAVVHTALLRDPRARCPSAADFAARLAPFAAEPAGIRQDMLVALPASEQTAGLDQEAPKTSPDALTISAPNTAPDPLVGRSLGGRYRIRRLLGKGGMGAVYEVEDDRGDRFAAKVISREVVGKDDHVRRFLREARAATSIDSPHVVRVHELGADDDLGVPFIIMELLTGNDLAALTRERGPIEPAPLVRVFLQAARGLAAAHRQGVVHRDIKPANVFLHAPNGRDVTVRICDFGIAKRTVDGAGEASQDLTLTGGLLGSPMYMSPEQAKNAKNVDHRTDIYSLSVSLYEALSGRRPWEGLTSLGEIMLAIFTKPVPPLSVVAPWVETELAALVQKGLSANPSGRFQSADEMAAALGRLTNDGEQVTMTELVGIDAERRSLARPPAAASSFGGGTSTAWQPTVDSRADRPSGNRPRAIVAGVALAAALAAAVVLGVHFTTGVATPRTAMPSAEPPPSIPQTRAFVEIGAKDASVRVDGTAALVIDGRISLAGEPGQSFDVVVSRGAATKSTRVVIARDGSVAPSRIDLEEQPPGSTATLSPAATPPASATARPVPPRSGGSRPTPAASGAKTATATPTAAPSPPADGSLTKEKW